MKRQVEAKGQKKTGFRSVRSIIAELKKVAWPTKQETMRLTVIVLIVAVTMAIILGAIDLAFSSFVDAVLIR
ncbi:preprotein translocase subunit SecE [Dehalococcoidia bacterium]|nr:preprotein translocase subunit SecE [Dehalococcoidia bacterium]MCL0075838.1 preprotein translocase subunit SecE [Dehalococcoidia bacterium]